MTLIMIWTEGADRWWVVSDSRLTGPSKGIAFNKITDCAAKILEIPVTLYAPEGNDPLGVPIKTTSLGFAYAGSSMVALHAYSAVLPLWSRLQNSPFDTLPSMKEFADHLAYFVNAYSQDIGRGCWCYLLGLDHTSDILEGWEIAAVNDTCEVRPIEMTNGIAAFGDGAKVAREKLDFLTDDTEYPQWKRAPVTVLRQMMLNKDVDTVGGAVQLGQLTTKGFEIYFDVLIPPTSAGPPQFKWRGFNLDEVGRVGKCIAVLRGVS